MNWGIGYSHAATGWTDWTRVGPPISQHHAVQYVEWFNHNNDTPWRRYATCPMDREQQPAAPPQGQKETR